MHFIVKLHSVNFLLNEYCIVLYCIVVLGLTSHVGVQQSHNSTLAMPCNLQNLHQCTHTAKT